MAAQRCQQNEPNTTLGQNPLRYDSLREISRKQLVCRSCRGTCSAWVILGSSVQGKSDRNNCGSGKRIRATRNRPMLWSQRSSQGVNPRSGQGRSLLGTTSNFENFNAEGCLRLRHSFRWGWGGGPGWSCQIGKNEKQLRRGGPKKKSDIASTPGWEEKKMTT